MKSFRFTRSARRHRIGKASARYVMEAVTPEAGVSEESGCNSLTWVGPDERGRELIVIAYERPDVWLVVHVMPTTFERKNP